ncbi:unnamed protein product [Lasius platythorax]|uniref:HTH CENPB-type domain-containing protein n=1 Tax=Lasius platythorax TaxID=488582 RepID=A0AAV2NJB8_9HYME
MSIYNYKTLDDQLYKWYLEQKTLGVTITQKLLRQEACAIAEKVGGPREGTSELSNFLWNFKKRHNIVLLRVPQYTMCIQNKRLNDQLYEWCQERQASGDTITKQLLYQEAYKIVEKLGEGPRSMCDFVHQFIQLHGILLEFRNTTEILQNPVQRDDEANQSDPEKFIQEFSQRLEKENISTDNIYIMIKTDRIWELLFLTMKGYVDLTRVTIQVMDDYNKKIRKTPFIFCTNVTGSNKLPPFFGALENEYENQSVSEHCESKLRENVSTKESENFAWWYNNVFKKFVKYHQKEKNIIGKVLLLVDNCTRRILSEEITQDDRFEVLFLPKNRVSFFQQLYYDILWYMEKEFRTYTLERLQNFSSEGKEFNINTHWITNVIYNSWVDVAYFLEKLWRRFLKQGRQTPEGTPILTSVSSQVLINSTGRDIVPDEIPVMYISSAEVEKEERQEQEKNTEGAENTRESRKRRYSKISVVNSEEKINISEEDFKQMASNEISNEVLSSDGEEEL